MKLTFKNCRIKSGSTSEYTIVYIAGATTENISRHSGIKDRWNQEVKEGTVKEKWSF